MCVALRTGFQFGGCFTESGRLAKPVSFPVCPFLGRTGCIPDTAEAPPGWGAGAGSRPAGSPGAPLGSDALQMRSHPLPPGLLRGMKGERRLKCMRSPEGAQPGWAGAGMTTESRGAGE